MKIFCCCCFLFIVCRPAFGQNLYPVKQDTGRFSFKISVLNSQLALVPIGETDLFRDKKDFPAIVAVRLEGADLVLEYRLKKNKDDLTYKIALGLQMPDSTYVTPPEYELSYEAGAGGTQRLVWLDMAENLPDFTTTYTLLTYRSLMGAVNCEGLRPTFTLKKKLPHYAAGGVGLALLGLGQVYRKQRDDYYADYQRRWVEGLPAPEPSGNPYETALEKDHSARVATWTGVGILAADALLYAYRAVQIKKKQKMYDKFCGQKTSMLSSPRFMLSPTGGANGGWTAGISLAICGK